MYLLCSEIGHCGTFVPFSVILILILCSPDLSESYFPCELMHLFSVKEDFSWNLLFGFTLLF